ncbi:MAG TPA: FAD-dependent oxidoreductase [Pyrinomonadaceae bacterium]|jgi:NADPH-dependent 2,4-dienoyl-CoA reductase/sulfur reductase-like enzyme/nitrite reductase/ring-hydroxylating ferredoxin subunit|nr:FAD-dependent oxidoreductase [Pyrinomonadaceae bacterium]
MSNKEVTVFGSDELQDGEMRQVSADGTDILLARIGGNYHAVGATCPHYGAPLAEGVLCGARVVCPWHHACFDVTTGDLVEPPALDALPRYGVRVEGGEVIVSLPDETADRRTPGMARRDSAADARTFVILGGGGAGYAAAQALREDGFQGRVLMITREERAPYDRPNLSKDYLRGQAEPEWMPLRADEFYAEHEIELLRGREVTDVDAPTRTITFGDGITLRYDSLLVATGGVPRRPEVPGSGLRNVFALRGFADADAVIEAAQEASHAVLIGAGFIGMEAASSLRERGLCVTVVAPGAAPFERILGAEIGGLLQRVHEANGVRFKLGASAARFEGDGAVKAVVLDSGERVEADLVVVGVGVRPATDFLRGVNLHEDGGVIVDEYMCAANGVYAAGDIACFRSPLTGERQRIEHWRTAQQQGRTAAHSMAGRATPFDGVPFFWTRQFDAGLLYVGHAAGWDEIIYQGDVARQDFLAFYVSGGRVTAVAGMNRDREMAAAEELMRLGRMPDAARLKGDPADLLALLLAVGAGEGGRSVAGRG